MTVKSYDEKCHDLASIFLEDEPELYTKDHKHYLACAIQTAIEDYIEDAKRGPGPNWDQWKAQLAVRLTKRFGTDGVGYIQQTGDECWREMFNDGLSAAEAADEEAHAAASSL